MDMDSFQGVSANIFSGWPARTISRGWSVTSQTRCDFSEVRVSLPKTRSWTQLAERNGCEMKVNWIAKSQNLKVKGKIQFCQTFTQLGTRFSLHLLLHLILFQFRIFTTLYFKCGFFIFMSSEPCLKGYMNWACGNLHSAKCTVCWCHYRAPPRSESHPTGCHRVQWQIWELWVNNILELAFQLQEKATWFKILQHFASSNQIILILGQYMNLRI